MFLQVLPKKNIGLTLRRHIKFVSPNLRYRQGYLLDNSGVVGGEIRFLLVGVFNRFPVSLLYPCTLPALSESVSDMAETYKNNDNNITLIIFDDNYF